MDTSQDDLWRLMRERAARKPSPPINLFAQYVALFQGLESLKFTPAKYVHRDQQLQLVKVPTGDVLTLLTPAHAVDERGELFVLNHFEVAQTFLNTLDVQRDFFSFMRETNDLQLRVLRAEGDEEYPAIPEAIFLYDAVKDVYIPLDTASRFLFSTDPCLLSAVNPLFVREQQRQERERWEANWNLRYAGSRAIRAHGYSARFLLKDNWDGSRYRSDHVMYEKFSSTVAEQVLAFYYHLGIIIGSGLRDDFFSFADQFITLVPVKNEWGSVSNYTFTYNLQAFIQTMRDTLTQLSCRYPDQTLAPVYTEIADLAFLLFENEETATRLLTHLRQQALPPPSRFRLL